MENNESQPKIKMLAWGDYCATTGFGTVMSNILQEVERTGRYEIDVIGINHTGDPYDKQKWPGNVWPAASGMRGGNYADLYGRQRLIDFVVTGKYDVVFMLQDTFVLGDMLIDPLMETLKSMPNPPKLVFYFPLDAPPQKKWIKDVVAKIDYPVTYTNWARDLVIGIEPTLKDRLRVIYHGTNLDEFQPVPQDTIDDFRHKWWAGRADGKFLISNINRNQPRKDTVRNLFLIKELKDRGRSPLMYMHMQVSDAAGNIFLMAEELGLDMEKDFMLPHPGVFNAQAGVGVDTMNLIYNSSDMVFTPTLGEGWGLSLTEAMATKTPVVGPRHTSVQEILADNRGFLVDSGDNPSSWFVQAADMDRVRPIINVQKAADAVERIMDGDLPDIDAAYAWVRQYSWERVATEWISLFDEAAAAHAALEPVVIAPNRASRRKQKKLKRVS